MPKTVVETCSFESMCTLHTYLTKILKDNGILSSETQIDQELIAKIIDPLVKIQNQLVNPSSL